MFVHRSAGLNLVPVTTDLVEHRVGGSRPTRPGRPTRRFAGGAWWVAILVVVVAIVVATIVILQTGTSPEQQAALLRQMRDQLASEVSTSPSPGTSLVPLNTPVTVTTHEGHFKSVSVTASNGQPLSGALDAKDKSWTSNQPLAPSTTYLVSATVVGASKLTATAKSSFTTLTPTATVTATVWPNDGLSVGVGQPIVLKFSQPVTDQSARQALISRFNLAMSSPVPVGAYWFSDTELHLRPENFWPTGEQISFSDSLSGWQAGSTLWGSGSTSVNFVVGDARISTANLATHEMTVTDNGKVVGTYPISGGRAQYPTMNGMHIVLDRESVVQMNSSTVGIPVNSPNGYNETVYWDVHISDSGEYVHAAPWSVADQGNTNVSHGCINISPANAEQFFNFSRVGDIVNVVGGPRSPVPGDHGVMDWTTPWSDFTPVNVTALPGSSSTSSSSDTSTPSSTSTTPSSTSSTTY